MAADLRAVTKFFLDRAELQKKVEQGQLRILSQFGAFTRRTARQSIRKGKGSAAPGQPPKSHRGDLRRLIFFAVDSPNKSVTIGPLIFDGRKPQSKMAQEVLEKGGTLVVPARTDAKGRHRESQTKRYRGNPFMGPAFAKELSNSKLSPLLSNSIR